MSGHGELEPCPYCGGHANLSKIGRDWYRIAADHVTGCPLEDFELDCPQSDDQLPLLLRDWNTRVDRRPANCAEKCDQLKAEIAGLKTGYEAYEAQSAALRKALSDCADELAAEIICKHGGQKLKDMHPVTRRLYERDMAAVTEARAAMNQGEQS